jgi:glycine/D-amino acid oxidase-like deaminating enzyme
MAGYKEYIQGDPALPGRAGSYWLASSEDRAEAPPLTEHITADVVVIGAGLAGVLTAYELVMRGADVVLLEARSALSDVTGHTTAKVTAVHGGVIADIAKRAGHEAAALHVAENCAAVKRIASLAGWLSIECDLAHVDTVAYVEDSTALESLEALREVLQAADAKPLAVTAEDWKLPYPMAHALRVENELRFHPLKFGAGVLGEFVRLGGRLFEHSRVLTLDDADDHAKASTAAGSVTAGHAVVCTSYPFHDHGSLFSRLYPHRSYVLGAYLNDDVPDVMYVALDEAPTIRLQPTPDGSLVIVSGQHHKAGAAGDERNYYLNLEVQMRQRFDVNRIEWHWSTQDNYTPDGMPYVGRSPGARRIYVVTGFAAWGMSQAAVAAPVISHQLAGTDHPLSDLYSPLRFEAGGTAEFLRENVNVTKEFASTLLAGGSAEDLKPGEGKRIRKGAHRVAAYRDYDGKLHEVSAACTHVGCGLEFNDAEKTWDCPCHGSRFSVDGTVLHGPAVRDLEPR